MPSKAKGIRAMTEGREGAMGVPRREVWTQVGAERVVSKSFLEAEATQPLEGY